MADRITPGYTPKKRKRTKTSGKSKTNALNSTASSTENELPDADKSKSEDLTEFLAEMRRKFHAIADHPNTSLKRAMGLEDLEFYQGQLDVDGRSGQWNPAIQARLTSRRRPVLTLNRIKPAVKQVTNSMRQNRPSPYVYPVDDKADKRTARILQGAVRHIEVNSMADVAYDTACNGQSISGEGFFRVIYKYATPYSFDQEAIIEEIDDPFSIYMGPHKPDCSDLNEVFIVYDYDPLSYEAEFKGKSQFSGFNDFTAIGNQAKGWGGKGSVRVVEYYYRTFETKTICKLHDGRVVDKSQIRMDVEIVELADGQIQEREKVDDEILSLPGFESAVIRTANLIDGEDGSGSIEEVQILEERDTEIPSVHWCKSNGVEKLDEANIPGEDIPVFEVVGDRQIVNGTEYRSGIVRDAKDAQRQYNYFRSKMAEVISLAPTSPWVMAEGQDEGRENEWDHANVENYAVLRYKPKSVSGHLAPPPQRNMAEPPIQAMVLASAQYEDDIKATTQVYDPKLGARSNEVSGRAIAARAAQSDTGNYNLHDNFARAVRRLGRYLVKVIPIIYDNRTLLRILGEDNKPEQVQITKDPNAPAYQEVQNDAGGIDQIYNIGVGIYDVAIGIGPNFLTKRQEAFEQLTKMTNSFPGLMEIGGDVILGNADIPGADELRNRMYKYIMSKFPDLADEGDQPPVPPKVKKAIDQMMQMIEAQTAQIEEYKKVLDSKQLENQGRTEVEKVKGAASVQSAQLSGDVNLRLEEMRIASNEHIAALNAQVKQTEIAVKAGLEQMSAKFSMIESMIAAINKPGPVEGRA